MPKIKLCLDIEIANYTEVAKNYSAKHNMPGADFLSMLPEATIRAAVDKKVVDKIQSKLGVHIAEEIRKELSEQGIDATVEHSYE